MSYALKLKTMQAKMSEQMADYAHGQRFSVLPEGNYQFRVKVALDETRKLPKRLMAVWCFVVDSGDQVGQQIWENTILEDNKVGAQICRDHVEDLGYEWPTDDLSKLEKVFEDISTSNPLIDANIAHRESEGKYTNYIITINEVLELPGGAETDTIEETEPPVQEEEENLNHKQTMLDFCASHGISGVTDDASLEEIIDALKTTEGIKFKEGELTDEEKEFLDLFDLGTLIEKKVEKKRVSRRVSMFAKKGKR